MNRAPDALADDVPARHLESAQDRRFQQLAHVGVVAVVTLVEQVLDGHRVFAQNEVISERGRSRPS
jgi:hypothetical protein